MCVGSAGRTVAMGQADGQASAQVQGACSVFRQDGETVEDAFTVDLGSEDIVADGHMSSPKTTSAHTSAPEAKTKVEVPEEAMAVGAAHVAETGRS